MYNAAFNFIVPPFFGGCTGCSSFGFWGSSFFFFFFSLPFSSSPGAAPTWIFAPPPTRDPASFLLSSSLSLSFAASALTSSRSSPSPSAPACLLLMGIENSPTMGIDSLGIHSYLAGSIRCFPLTASASASNMPFSLSSSPSVRGRTGVEQKSVQCPCSMKQK